MTSRHRLAGLAFVLALLAAAPGSRAEDAPTFADREDDEVRAADRAFGFMINPLAVALGVFGGEADFVLGRHAVVAAEGGVYRRRESVAVATGVGLLVYPFNSALHGAYIGPHLIYARRLNESVGPFDWGADAIGLGATAGWQWTWDYGLSVRVGAGVMYFLGDAGPNMLATGAQPVLDGSFGWTF
jgi:hypothetical protein